VRDNSPWFGLAAPGRISINRRVGARSCWRRTRDLSSPGIISIFDAQRRLWTTSCLRSCWIQRRRVDQIAAANTQTGTPRAPGRIRQDIGGEIPLLGKGKQPAEAPSHGPELVTVRLSVDRWKCRHGIELRNPCWERRPCWVRGKAIRTELGHPQFVGRQRRHRESGDVVSSAR
jgi:hypothetical protein